MNRAHSSKRRRGSRAVLVACVALVTVVALTACTATPSAPAAGLGAVAPPIPAGVQDPAVIPTSANDTTNCGNPVASLRPAGTLPAPGHMPAGSTMAKIAAHGVLRVGVDQNTYLFGYFNPTTGVNEGFDIDMLHAIAKAIFGDPSKIDPVAITSAERIPYLQQNKVDIVADTMTINCVRWQQVDFSSVYYNAGQSLLVPTTSRAKTLADLGGQRVCAAAGSTSIQYIALVPSHPIPVAVNDWTDCLVMLQQDQVAAISTDDTILRGLAAQDPHVHLVGSDFTSEPYGLAMRQDAPDFVRFVNGVLAKMRTDGQWTTIYDRWLGAPAPTPPVAAYKD
jgi:polar amino acid transport system substrate-binding protein